MAEAFVETVSVAAGKQRNVVVVGKTGAGKSTVANMILGKGEGKFELGSGFTSTSTEIQARNCVLETSDGNKYSVKVIDTIGLFDTKAGEPGNRDAMNAVKTFFLKEAPEGVNLVIFVVRHGRWTDEEQKTFEFITKQFTSEISPISALVFTACENKSETKRNTILEEFTEDEYWAKIARFMGKGLYTVGFPDIDDPEMLPGLKEVYKHSIKKDQEKIRNLVYRCEDKYLSDKIVQRSFWSKCTIL